MPLGSYSQMLQQAQSSYQAMINGYNSALQNQVVAQQSVEQGYSQLYHDVLSGIKGVGTSQSQAIADTYSQRAGGAMQSLINAGLGNTTVQQSVGRGLSLDEEKAQIALANQVSQLYAGYESQLGLAGLNYRGQAVSANTALQTQQLGALGGYAQSMGNWALQGYSIDAQLRAQQLRNAGIGGVGSSPVRTFGGNQPGGPQGAPVASGGFRSSPSNPYMQNPAANPFEPSTHVGQWADAPTYTPGGSTGGGSVQAFPLGAAGGYGGFGGEDLTGGWASLPEAAQGGGGEW